MIKLISIIPSKSKGKKWEAKFSDDGKERVVSFGADGYRDYTLISNKSSKFYLKDKSARELVKKAYIRRHIKREEKLWKSSPMSPATLSRFILWEKPTMASAKKAFKARFKV